MFVVITASTGPILPEVAAGVEGEIRHTLNLRLRAHFPAPTATAVGVDDFEDAEIFARKRMRCWHR
jgi:hypothetical protein